MKRAILRLTAEEFGRSCLNLGRADENIAVRVEIDLSRILAQEPTATAHINVENPSGTEYAAVTSMDGTKLIWDVTKADNTVEGTGCAQLTVEGPNGEVLKSAVAATRVGHSIRGEGPAPDPVQNWIDDATNQLGNVVQAGEEAEKAAAKANAATEAANESAQKAEDAAVAATAAAAQAQALTDTVQSKLDNGDFVGAKGEKGDKGETGATGPQGEPGSDASVTRDNVVSALGYTPADIPHQFHLIQETTVESDVSVIRLTDLNLKEIYVLFIQPSTGYAAINLDTTIYFSKAVGGSPSIYGWWSIMGAAASQESMGYVQVRGRLLDAAFQQMQNYKMMQTNPRVLKYIVEDGTTLTGIKMTANAAKYPVGMVVRIYGVDA